MATPVKTWDEFQVNTYTTASQTTPSIASLIGGGFIVSWVSQGEDGDGNGIYGQLFDADGNAVNSAFKANTFTTGDQYEIDSVGLSSGDFVVTWYSAGQEAGGVYAQRYNASGVPQGSEFRVNTETASAQRAPSIAALSGGGFVVTWQSFDQDGSLWGVYGQRFDATATPVGSEFQLSTFTAGIQAETEVAGLAGGGFVAVWHSKDQVSGTSDFDIYAQRYDASGTAVGGEFLVNTHTDDVQYFPDIVALAGGGFVVAWTSVSFSANPSQDGSAYGLFAQRFDAAGNALGSEFQVNTYTTGSQTTVRLTALSDGGFVATWMSLSQDGNGWGSYAQRYDASGTKIGSEFLVNTTTQDDQFDPVVADLAGGALVFAFGNGDRFGDAEISAQHFSYTDIDFTTGNDTVTLYGFGQTVHALDGHDYIIGADRAAGSDIIYGDGGNDIMLGRDGDDILIGGDGNDIFDGGDGNDTASFVDSLANVTVDLMLAVPQNTGEGNDSLAGIENLTTGIGDDHLYGDGEANILDGGFGADTMAGRAGNDIYLVDNSADVIAEVVDEGTDTVRTSVSYTLPANVERLEFYAAGTAFGNDLNNQMVGSASDYNTLFGLSGNDLITILSAGGGKADGGIGSDILNGGPGDDILIGGAGSDILDGGAGTDTGDYTGSTTTLTVDLGLGTATGASIGADTLTAIENILGGSGQNWLYGDGQANELTGGGDVDRIWGGTGNDVIYGGGGNDTLRGEGHDDEIHGEGANDWINGGGGDDTIYGDAGADTVYGSTGMDTIYGGSENDTLRGEGDDDEIHAGTENDWVYGGAGADTIYGDAGYNRIYGGTENDTVHGGSGIDIIRGEDGADTLHGNADNDWIYGGDGADIITTGLGYDRVYGGLGNDTVTGGDEIDIIRGEDDDDTLNGNGGNDWIYGGGGTDTIATGLGYDRAWGGDGADTLTGDAEIDILYGEAGIDVLIGAAGNDWLYGGLDDDTLTGGAGYDRLEGNEGNDTFKMVDGFGVDIIRDWQDTGDGSGYEDRIDFSGYAAVTGWGDISGQISYAGGDATITIGTDVITLVGITGGLAEEDFLF